MSSTKLSAASIHPPESGPRRQAPPGRELSTPAKSGLPLLLGAAGGAFILLILLLMMFTGTRIAPTNPRSTAQLPEPVTTPLPVPRPGPAELLARELDELDARTLPLLRNDRVAEVSKLLAQARGNHSSVEWLEGIDERIRKVEPAARRIAAPILEQVGIVARRGDAPALREIRNRVEALGVTAVLADFDRAASEAVRDPWIVLDLGMLGSEGGATLSKRGDRSILVSGPNPDQDTYSAVALVGLKQVRAFRVEALPDPSLPAGGPGRADNGNICLSEFKVAAGGRRLVFAGVSADHEQDRYPASAAIDGNPLTAWAVGGNLGEASAAVFHLESPVDLESVAFTLEHRTIHARHALGRFRISVAVLQLPPPPPPRYAEAAQVVSTTPLQIPPALLAYQTSWVTAARQAATRDFASALKVLEDARTTMTDEALRKEAAADLADLRAAADAVAEVPRLLPRWAKGTKLKLQYLSGDGSAQVVEGTVLEASAKGVTVQTDDGIFEVPSGELGAESIAMLLGLRGEKRSGDVRASAVLEALQGRPPADLTKKFSDLKSASDSKESEARRLFWLAEEEYAGAKAHGQASGAYAALLEKYAQTAFVVRNRPFIEDRLSGTRDLFYFADDLVGAGTFSLSKSPKLDSFWSSSADSPPGKAAPNFLEADALIQPNLPYRAWVYAGGCCQEVFGFFIQGTGLTGPSARNPKETVTAEPGSEEWIAVKPPPISLKKKHSDHTGPKESDRWSWVDLGVLKFAQPGMKKLRILTDQKGFSVAYLALSGVRQSPPRDSEVKDLLKAHPPAEFGPTGTILREIWRGIPGTTVADLLNHPKFKEGKPDLTGPITYIDSWDMGTDYGCRIRGYVHPPTTGDYIFWIASDDEGELWLSTDDTPAKKQRLCILSRPVGQRDWNADPAQKSNPIGLIAGKRYYIEVLQKQGAGPEHVAVGWQLPGGAQERPIPPPRLSPLGALPSFHRSVRRGPPASPSVSPDSPILKSAYVGGTGGVPFQLAPVPRVFLRGLRYTIGDAKSPKALQPLFAGPSGDSVGEHVGEGDALQELAAPPGYAVGGMVVRATDRLNAFKLIYMRISGARLMPLDRSESDWVGGSREGGTETLLGGDGTPVLGIFGNSGAWIDGVGLLLLGK
ncbi:MAG TPA: PA14 domain-containing protein [Planctomycetota bacterium]|nr:PA14 domain-containing protein [Planctomycetota bacterium]